MNVQECKSEGDWSALLTESHESPVYLFKHSTTCSASAGAWQRFSRFAEEVENVRLWRILVRENRVLAEIIAEQTGVKHESPQVILFRYGRPIGSRSHRAITESSLRDLLSTS